MNMAIGTGVRDKNIAKLQTRLKIYN